MRILLAVALGGALGAVARYLAAEGIQAAAGASAFPWGTLAVNVAGSFALGLLLAGIHAGWFPADVRPFLAVGVLGSFTTFSTFSWETVTLLQEGETLRAGAYVAASVGLGLLAAAAGLLLPGAGGALSG